MRLKISDNLIAVKYVTVWILQLTNIQKNLGSDYSSEDYDDLRTYACENAGKILKEHGINAWIILRSELRFKSSDDEHMAIIHFQD